MRRKQPDKPRRVSNRSMALRPVTNFVIGLLVLAAICPLLAQDANRSGYVHLAVRRWINSSPTASRDGNSSRSSGTVSVPSAMSVTSIFNPLQ